MTKQERRSVIIKTLHGLGVFYDGDRYIEKLTMGELEYLHISKKCLHVSAIIAQKGNPAPHRVARGKFIPIT